MKIGKILQVLKKIWKIGTMETFWSEAKKCSQAAFQGWPFGCEVILELCAEGKLLEEY